MTISIGKAEREALTAQLSDREREIQKMLGRASDASNRDTF